jgi:hypothetical protein
MIAPFPANLRRLPFVMPGLVPGIHVFGPISKKDMDGRDIGERKRRRPSDG